MKNFLKPTISKILIAVGLFPVSAIVGYIVANSSNSGDDLLIGSVIFFPVGFYIGIRYGFLTYVPVGDDVMRCVIPFCDTVAFVTTVVLSVALYYAFASAIFWLWCKLQSRMVRKVDLPPTIYPLQPRP